MTMETWYQVAFGWQTPRYHPVQVSRSTEKCVWIKPGGKYMKRTTNHVVVPTEQEAIELVREQIHVQIAESEMKIQYEQRRMQERQEYLALGPDAWKREW